MSTHLNLCFPEWQGYAESNSVYFGALRLQEILSTTHQFTSIPVPENEDLFLENDIIGYDANLRQLKATSHVLKQEKPASIFMVGGTCAAEIAPVSYLNKYYDGNLTVLWLDAHGDLNTPQSSPSKHFHGMPLRALLGESDPFVLQHAFSRLNPDQVVLAGTRDLDKEEERYIARNQVEVVTPRHMAQVVDRVLSKEKAHVYVHIDLDVLDPSSFPHLLLPIPGGVLIESLLKELDELVREIPLVGASIVEYVPDGNSGEPVLKEIVAALGLGQ